MLHMEQRWGRVWFAATAAVVLAGLVIQVLVTATADGGHFATPAARVANMFTFFTIDSNVIVGVTTLLLALPGGWKPAWSTVFRVFRLAGLVAITITGVVYHLLLAGLAELTAWGTVADVLLHTVVPIMAVAGWLLFGPRGRTSPRIAVLALVFPVCWLAMTLVRGPIVDWYPYPFVDVADLGYPRVLLNVTGISALFLAVAFGAVTLDRVLTARRAAAAPRG